MKLEWETIDNYHTRQKYPDIDLNLAATDISEFWRQANELVRGANNV